MPQLKKFANGVRMRVTQLKKEDGEQTISVEEAADELCRSFKDVFTVEDDNSVTEDDNQDNVEQQSDQLQDVEFTVESVYKMLLNPSVLLNNSGSHRNLEVCFDLFLRVLNPHTLVVHPSKNSQWLPCGDLYNRCQ